MNLIIWRKSFKMISETPFIIKMIIMIEDNVYREIYIIL